MENVLVDVSRHELRVVIGLAVCLVWLIISLATLVTKDYTPLSIVTPVMLIVVAALYTKKINGNGSSDEK